MQLSSLQSDEEWSGLLGEFPPSFDFSASAQSHGALQRLRKIRSGEDMLRLALAYGPCGLSLRQAGAWATASGLADLSDVAVLKRLRKCGPWLEALCGSLIDQQIDSAGTFWRNRRVRIADATSISGPGSKGTDWRLHASLDLSARCLGQCELTDVHGGESLERFSVSAGEIWLADRGYGLARNLQHLICHQADFVIRLGWRRLRLQQADGSRFDLFAALETIKDGETGEWSVFVHGHAGHIFPLRLLVRKKSAEATGRERHKITAKAAKHPTGRADPRSLIAAEFMILGTSLPDIPSDEIFALYRLRWQIELAFKRLKSLIHIDRLPAKDPDLARTWLLAHLLAALIIDRKTSEFLDSPPCADD